MTKDNPFAGIGKDCLERNRAILTEAGWGNSPYMPRDPSKPNKAEIQAEKELLRLCRGLLAQREIEDFHVPPMERCKKGWPDSVFSLPLRHSLIGVPIALELKTLKGRLTPEQVTCLTRMAANGWVALVLRSFDAFRELLDVQDMEELWRYIGRQTECFNDLPELQDLGWMNPGLDGKPEPLPPIVTRCRELGHTPADVAQGSESHHVVTCRICRYFFSYDSSD